MTFGYRSSRGGYRSPRSSSSSRGTFRGRGRGSDSYFRPGRGSTFSGRSSYRGGSFKGSSFHDREEFYESRSSGSKYGHDRYGSSHSRKEEEFYHRDGRESTSGSFSREHSRRNDFEPERKRMKSETSFKEGASPRRSYDDLEHSSRNYSSSSSSYHSDTSPFKSHKKEYADFKKPLPLSREFTSRRPTRAIRARGGISRTVAKPIKPLMASSLKRVSTGRISKASTATRLQLLLRKKKQLRIQRLRRARDERQQKNEETKFEDEGDIVLSEEEEDAAENNANIEVDANAEESNQSPESKKVVTKEIKKIPKVEPEDDADVDVSKSAAKDKTPTKGFHRPHITLKCVHCKSEYPTFKVYMKHLQMYKHKKAMEGVLFRLRKKLSKMRTDQRDQQRMIDKQCEEFARTSYCKLCKLNYKQTKQEHYTSDFHIGMSEFLQPKCADCSMTFATPILYEHHRSTLAHIKRRANLAARKMVEKNAGCEGDDNNDEDGFMVLDSVGSADESDNENEDTGAGQEEDKQALRKKRKDSPTIVGNEFIKKVMCYYCKLCGLCLRYNPKVGQDEMLLAHCRTRFHLKLYSLEKLRKQKEEATGPAEMKEESTSVNDAETSDQEEQIGNLWTDENDEERKMSEDEEDSKSSIRYDRFGHSDEKENIDKQKTNIETDTGDASKTEKSSE